jgi:membrane protein implicated in regulation of membrane protease activity
MNGRRTLLLVVALALLSAGAIIAMLLVDGGAFDRLLFVVAALPLAYGFWRWRAERRTPQ